MKAAKVTSNKAPAKGCAQKSKKPGNSKETNGKGSAKTNSSSTAKNTAETKSRKPKAAGLPNAPASAVQTAADERRLRKLKVYLKSVSYNGCEGTILPNLNDLYVDQLLVEEFPCNELSKHEEFKCNPTPFVIASCFNRTQVSENSNNSRGNKGTRKTTRNPNPSPRKRNPQKPVSTITTKKQDSPLKSCTPQMLQQRVKTISAEIKSPVNKILTRQGDKLEHNKPKKEEKESKESPVVLEEKKAVKDEKTGSTVS